MNRLLNYLHKKIRHGFLQFEEAVKQRKFPYDTTRSMVSTLLNFRDTIQMKSDLLEDSPAKVSFHTSTPRKIQAACEECRKRCKWKQHSGY